MDSENFDKETKSVIKSQSEVNNTITEIKNTLEGTDNRLVSIEV